MASDILSSDEGDHLGRGSVNAWDLSVGFGTPVYSMASGEVTYAGCNNAGGYGCWALVDHENGYSSIYAHLIDEGGGQIWVRSGEKVSVWTPLGRVGWTGKTSFGPHVHFEIRHSVRGRLRLDSYFSRASMNYCKFCAGGAAQTGGIRQVVTANRVPYMLSGVLSYQVMMLLLFVLLLLLALWRPEMAAKATRQFSLWALQVLQASGQRLQQYRESRRWSLVSLAIAFFIPAFLCGGSLAVGVWMADEGVRPTELWMYVRWGFAPMTGLGYQSGAKYSAVWGTPCRLVGTLGRVCEVDEIVQAAQKWQEDVYRFGGAKPVPAVIPRISSVFGYRQTRYLLYAVHQVGGIVIVDVAGDMAKAREAIDELAQFGLDGVAIDLEFMDNVSTDDIQRLAQHLADRRREANLAGEGVLVVWNVFHNLRKGGTIAVEGVKVIPIFTGYGSSAAKVAGFVTTQKLFDVGPAEAGLMAFDQRWPINPLCRSFDIKIGFDCQSWHALFANPMARSAGWWVQQ